MTIRTQLSLYVPQPVSQDLEAVRKLLDPIQARLIPAHVTLCREDELASLDPSEVRSRLAARAPTAITLRFGHPQTFHEHGILLPCVSGEAEFEALRLRLLDAKPRGQSPHITLAHPRNPRSATNTSANVASIPSSLVITFTSVCRIQQEGSAPWQVLERYALAGTASDA